MLDTDGAFIVVYWYDSAGVKTPERPTMKLAPMRGHAGRSNLRLHIVIGLRFRQGFGRGWSRDFTGCAVGW